MIVTAKSKIPLLWQFTIAAPNAALRFKYMIMGSVFVFSIRKFIENPAEITFLMSLPGIITIAVAPIASFMSDRVWSRFGRRKIFAVPSMVGVVLAFIAMPLMPNVWGLIIAYIFYELCHDFGNATFEVLKQEVVPPKQRGTAAAISTWIQNISNLTFWLIALGRFDDYQYYAGFPVSGEQSLYWGVALIIFMMGLLIIFGVKETYQPSKLTGERFTLRTFFGGLLNRNLWPVYLLVTGWIVAHAGLGSLGALLYTEQWGFTKQEMGINVAAGATINIFLIIIIGWFADKLPRMRSFEILLFISILIELSWYIYVEFILFDKTPTLVEVILFGEIASIAGILLGMLYIPLVYDYIPRNEMGTFVAGRNITQQILRVITLNGVGVFVTAYSALFLPPGGDMARVTLAEIDNQESIEAQLVDPVSGIANDRKLTVRTYFATNAAFDDGRAFEIRRENSETMDLKAQRDALNEELKAILAKISNAEGRAARAAVAGDTALEQESLDWAASLELEAEPFRTQIADIEAQQQASADAFLAEIQSAIGSRLMVDGSQVEAIDFIPATLFEVPLATFPDKAALARTLDYLRHERPDLIDIKLANRDFDFYLELSVTGAHDDPAFTEALAADFRNAAKGRIADVIETPFAIEQTATTEAVRLQLKVLEDPINNYISPVTKVIYGIWDWFGDPPVKERRINAMARGLRSVETSAHVSVSDKTEGDRHAVLITAVYTQIPGHIAESETISESTITRIQSLIGPEDPRTNQVLDLYQRSLPAAAANRLTVPSPVLISRFSPPQYDYMSGYLWIISMSIFGLLICLLFTRRERKGLIEKRGRIESEKEAEAEAAAEANASSTTKTQTYLPGFVPHKIAMTLAGIGLIALGLIELGPTIKTALTGESTIAIASKVVKERIGADSVDLTSDAAILQSKESFDRSFVFWNYFKFETADGEVVEFRADTGKQLEPAYTLRDPDGLPTSVRVLYFPATPKEAIIPSSYSTWFLSGVLMLVGTLTTIFGGLLLYYARKPIAMPILKGKDAPED